MSLRTSQVSKQACVVFSDTKIGPPVWQPAAGRPGKGEKRKGKNRSDPKVNCGTRRVRFCFLCSGQKSRSYPSGVKNKYLEALSPESGAIGGGKGCQTRGRAHSGLPSDFFCASRARGHFWNVPGRRAISGNAPGAVAPQNGHKTQGVTNTSWRLCGCSLGRLAARNASKSEGEALWGRGAISRNAQGRGAREPGGRRPPQGSNAPRREVRISLFCVCQILPRCLKLVKLSGST